MSITTAIVRELMLAGLEGEALLAALDRIEAASAPARTKRQERDRRYYEAHREEKIASVKARQAASKDDATETTETTETTENVGNDGKATESDGNAGGEKMSPKNNNQTPKTPSPFANASGEGDAPDGARLSPSKTKSSDWPADAFDQFWSAYPNRVGKQDAAKAFDRVRRAGQVPFDRLMAGLGAYRSKTDDRPWCNPATWLNQGRWDDAPALPLQGASHGQQSTRQDRTHSPARPQGTAARVAAIMGYGPQSDGDGSEEERRLPGGGTWPEGRDTPGIIDAHPGPTGIYRA